VLAAAPLHQCHCSHSPSVRSRARHYITLTLLAPRVAKCAKRMHVSCLANGEINGVA